MDSITDILGIMIPITALMIPIVAILTAHQRKMAELIHSRQSEGVEALRGRMAQMELEMQELRDRVNSSAIAADRPPLPHQTTESAIQARTLHVGENV